MTWFRSPKILSAIIFLLLIGLVWFAGPLMGLKTIEARFALIFLIMLIWVVILMIGKLIRERSANVLEKMIRRKADDAVVSASPENRAEVALLRQRLLGAIETLKTSNIGKTRGKAALYELPWYMIVGHPSAGKSCAILNSGLKFPLAAKGNASVQGIGGTRNCDWFFSTEGVLLDTAGRYSTQAEDRSEWLEFLKLLKKHRSKAPLNGILVALSLPELLQHQSEAFVLYARQIRQRINEVDDIFGTKIPVYLVFTKLDLLRGFGQFYEDLNEDERQQVWGATLTHDQPQNFDAVRVIGQHFEALFQGLTQMGTDKLAGNRANQKRPALFAFPLEFHGLKDAVCKFTEHLVEHDPYHTKPLIRGFYFTSALQENNQSITTGNRVSSQFDLTKFGFRPSELLGSRPFFLESLFRKVVFPDMYLVGRTTSPNRNRWRLAGIATGMLLLALMAGCWTWSFVGNQQLISAAQDELAVSRGLYRKGDLGDRLKALQVLQYRLEQLYQYRQEGRPWKISWGLYHGDDIEKALRAEYFAGVRQTMLDPLKQQLETKLTNSLMSGNPPAEAPKPAPPANPHTRVVRVSNPAQPKPAAPAPEAAPAKPLEDTYNILKTYLMLHSQEHMDSAHLTDQMPRHWRTWLEANHGNYTMEEISRMAERTVAFYVSQEKEPDLPLIDNRDDLVNQVRAHLKGEAALLSPLERIYNELKAQGNTKFAPVTVASILNNRDMDVVGGSAAVPGSFTREAWNKYFRLAIDEAAVGKFKGTDWVLASSLQDNLDQLGSIEERQKRLMAMYQNDYIKEWEKFLQGVVVHPFSDFDRASIVLSRLADPQSSPIKMILVRAAYETAWDSPSELSKRINSAGKNIVQQTETLLGVGSDPTRPGMMTFSPVSSRFAPLSELVGANLQPGAPPSGRAPIDGYLDLLVKIRTKLASISSSGDVPNGSHMFLQTTLAGSGSELAEALQYVDGPLLARMDDGQREAARPLLVRPLIETFAAVVPPAVQDLDRIWQQQVYTPWSSLGTKYPFADSGNEAQLSEIAKFLKPGEGTLAKFVDKELGPLVTRRGDDLVARTWGGQGIGISPSFLDAISHLMAAGGTLLQEGDSCKFELQPVPTPGLTDILLEIDGQKIWYRMGPQAWIPIAWPGNSSAQGVRLQATSFIGATTMICNFPGRLGLLRLLDQARVENPRGPNSSLEWRFKVTPAFSSRNPTGNVSQEAYYPQGIRFNLRLVGGTNPLELSSLRHHSLPQRVGI
jgi:type VI secretion system protein ImpL